MGLKAKNLLFIITVIIIVSGCNPTRNIPEQKYLLNKNHIELSGKETKIKKSNIRPILKQKSNKRVLGFRFHLWLYNRANKKKEDNWLRRIGEPPIIYDQSLTLQSLNQINQYLNNKGYYNSLVEDTVIFKNKKAEVTYLLNVSEPYTIEKVNYLFEDYSIRDAILADTINSLIQVENNFDLDILQKERSRIEKLMKNKGYYKFSKEYIFYEADTTLGNKSVALTLYIKNAITLDENGNPRTSRHKKYYISNVNIIPDAEKKILLNDSSILSYDTISHKGINILYKPQEIVIKPNVLTESNYLHPYEYYSQNNVDRTYNKYSSLKVFKTTNISFNEENTTLADSIQGEPLNCEINMTPYPRQGYAFELEGTNTGGNFGVGGNLLYSHRNLFRGAEQLDIGLNANIEFLGIDSTSNIDFSRAIELGAEGKITFPRFLFPFGSHIVSNKFNPKTALTFSYTYQRLEFLTKSTLNARLGYSWKSGKFLSHTINPFEVSSISATNIGGHLRALIDSSIYYKNIYTSHLVTVSNYSVVFNNQNINKNTFYVYLRYNVEVAGNFLNYLYNKFDVEPTTFNETNENESTSAYTLFGVPFSQFMKTDLDVRFSIPLNRTDRIVTRMFGGIIIPYKNSTTAPFERQYISGGANGIRAWKWGYLGPGDYYDQSGYETGDIKLEANIEYRFKLFWMLEGALFVDAGNLWTLQEEKDAQGNRYRSDKTIDEIAVGAGSGLRLILPFFVLRLDAGYKLIDPALKIKKEIGEDFVRKDKINLEIGIGYPF